MDTVNDSDDKYVTFNRRVFNDVVAAVEKRGKIGTAFENFEIADAVVIRRQDKFASPCLLTYASMISMVGEHHPDPDVRAELLAIADYFQRQGEMAGDEARGLPTL